MRRSSFLKLGGMGLLGLGLDACRPSTASPSYTFSGDNHSLGHYLRHKKNLPNWTKKTKAVEVLIVGGGISGLSCARALQQGGMTDFLVIDPEAELGGNSRAGASSSGAFPFAAHYLPIPGLNQKELLRFLSEIKVIQGFSEGIPEYDPVFLCADPQERLLINGIWQEGLSPTVGISEADKASFRKFETLLKQYKSLRGKDEDYVFAIPLQDASKDPHYDSLWDIAFLPWLSQQGITSEALTWYLNYCCLDDFGIDATQCSAFMGLHYFCSRRGEASNAQNHDVLTWPEGNAFLARKLAAYSDGKHWTHSLVCALEIRDEGSVVCTVLKEDTKEIWTIEAQQVVLACPKFIAHRLLQLNPVKEKRPPWLVCNFELRSSWPSGFGEPLSWDNVIYGKHGLGYIHSNNQDTSAWNERFNLTHYIALDAVGIDRRKLSEMSEAELIDLCWTDMLYAHPDMKSFTETAHVHVLGHGMAAPVLGNRPPIYTDFRSDWPKQCIPAHSDYCGYSIFEEAFYQGFNAANEVLGKEKRI